MTILGQDDAIAARRIAWMGGQALQVCTPSRFVTCSRTLRPGDTFVKLFDDDLDRLIATASLFTKVPIVQRPGLRGQHVELFGSNRDRAIFHFSKPLRDAKSPGVSAPG